MRISPKKMKSKTIVYLTKNKSSAALKRAALDDYFGGGEIDVLPSGKPVIVNPMGYYISVSHSAEIVGVVISDVEVGIDIEVIRDFNYDNLYGRFLSLNEKQEVKDKNSFFKVWVRKEAESKISGEGIFSLRQRDTSAKFTDISKEISVFAGKEFCGCIASFSSFSYIVKEI